MQQKNSKKSSEASDTSDLWNLGGPVWINFTNSLVLANKGMMDVTGSPGALIWWLDTMGIFAPAKLEPKDLLFAAGLRESFSRVLDNLQAGTPQTLADLALINCVLKDQRSWSEIDQLESGAFVEHVRRASDTIQQAVGLLVFSLCETLTKGDLTRLRTCAHPDCVLRFYDDSKNGSRKWCSMSECGNRAKATAFLDRKRSKTK